jgi:hypothetical protein
VSRGEGMNDLGIWDELTRPEQRLLIKLFGGGSLRNEPLGIVGELQTRGLISEHGLTATGLRVFVAARRRQQATWPAVA